MHQKTLIQLLLLLSVLVISFIFYKTYFSKKNIVSKKIEIIELPVKWVHKNDSKINLIRDSFSIFWSIIKMKKKFN